MDAPLFLFGEKEDAEKQDTKPPDGDACGEANLLIRESVNETSINTGNSMGLFDGHNKPDITWGTILDMV